MQVALREQAKYLAFQVTTNPSSKIPGYQTSMREDANQAVDGTMYFSITNSSTVSSSISHLYMSLKSFEDLLASRLARRCAKPLSVRWATFQLEGRHSNAFSVSRLFVPQLLLSIISSRHVMAFSTALQSDALNSRVVLQIGYLRSPEIRVIRKANEDYDSTLRYSLFQSVNYTVRLLYHSKSSCD